MTTEAKTEISRILVLTESRLVGRHGPFRIIHEMLKAYMVEWGWVEE